VPFSNEQLKISDRMPRDSCKPLTVEIMSAEKKIMHKNLRFSTPNFALSKQHL